MSMTLKRDPGGKVTGYLAVVTTMNTYKRVAIMVVLAVLPALPIMALGASFTDVAQDIGIFGTGRTSSWADVNNDGCVDIFTVGKVNRFFRNNCDGTFTNSILATGLPVDVPNKQWTSAWADYDADGDMDVYLSSGGAAGGLYENDGFGRFARVSAAVGIDDETFVAGASWADYDGDGDLDLFLAGRFNSSGPTPDLLYRNDGGVFTEVGAAAGVRGPDDRLTFTGNFFDFDNDGDVDLYLAVDFGPDVLYKNNGDGTFTDESTVAGISAPEHGMGVAIGDLDNNGCFDIIISNNGQPRADDADTAEHGPSALYMNNCDGTFSLETSARGILDRGVVEWGLNMVDYDYDGDLDIAIVAGGMLASSEPNVFYENDGSGQLFDITSASGTAAGGSTFGSVWADYDNDGDLDWLVTAVGGAQIKLFRNDSVHGNFLKVLLLDNITLNRNGIGAEISIIAGSRTQRRVIMAGSSYASSEEPIAVFGIGVKNVVDRVAVRWPSGNVTVVEGVAANQTIIIENDFAGLPGTVSGIVTDADGVVVDGARVGLRITGGTGLAHTTATNADGLYEIGGVAPGQYDVRARLIGFSSSSVEKIDLLSGQNWVVDLVLRDAL